MPEKDTTRPLSRLPGGVARVNPAGVNKNLRDSRVCPEAPKKTGLGKGLMVDRIGLTPGREQKRELPAKKWNLGIPFVSANPSNSQPDTHKGSSSMRSEPFLFTGSTILAELSLAEHGPRLMSRIPFGCGPQDFLRRDAA